MAWESIGSTSTGNMPADRAWILQSLELAKTYVLFACGGPPYGSQLQVMWHEHELGEYPSLGVWSDYDTPDAYISSCERALEVFDAAVSWGELKDHFPAQETTEDEEEDESELEDDVTVAASIDNARGDQLLRAFELSAKRCGDQILENVAYIEKELPAIELDATLREQINSICATLIGTKHDLVSELFELDALRKGPSISEKQARVMRIVNGVREDLLTLHEVVTALGVVGSDAPQAGLAYPLVAESAVNVLVAFSEMSDAADQYLG